VNQEHTSQSVSQSVEHSRACSGLSESRGAAKVSGSESRFRNQPFYSMAKVTAQVCAIRSLRSLYAGGGRDENQAKSQS
jgi:hypothetical protein